MAFPGCPSFLSRTPENSGHPENAGNVEDFFFLSVKNLLLWRVEIFENIFLKKKQMVFGAVLC